MVAPVPAVGLDQVGREDRAGAEGDDRDLMFVGDGQDPPTGMSRAELCRFTRAKGARRARVVLRLTRSLPRRG